MQIKTRNSVVLCSLWLLITAGLFYWQFRQHKELDEINKINNELNHLPALVQEVDSLTARSHNIKSEYDSRKKEIPLSSQPAKTYAFVIDGLGQAGNMKLDIEVAGTQALADGGFNRFLLRQGEGQFNNIYRLIHYLENGKTLQKIHSLNLTQEDKFNEETRETGKSIKFQMELHSYFSTIPELETSSFAKALPVPPPPLNPFFPRSGRISKGIPPSEVDPDAAEVKAVIPGKAFVQYKNVWVVLQVGDKLRRGYVSDIDPSEGKVEFSIVEGGVTRKIEKRIQFEKRN